MVDPTSGSWPVTADAHVVHVRRSVRALAVDAGLGLVGQTKLVTAASELARNIVEHAGGGRVRARLLSQGGRRGVEVVFEDDGPGIDDVELALTDGHTSGRGLGLGLGGARRLTDVFELETEPGAGTRVRVVRWA